MTDTPRINLLQRLIGRKSLPFLLGLLALAVVRYTRVHELPPLARESILLRLKADYSRPVLQAASNAGHDRATLATTAAQLANNQKVEIEQATTRGILWPKYVRVEVSANGQPPPLGDRVRYFTIDLAGTATSEVSCFKYYFYLW